MAPLTFLRFELARMPLTASFTSPATGQRLELLAPAKTADFGIEAINHGADAVYIGGPAFGARANAGNEIADIARLAEHAHRYNARVLVALNTILHDSELEGARRTAHAVYAAGADALIAQDMGLLELDLPPIQLHASTQTDIRNPAKAKFLEDAGFSQIVLAREMSIDEIGKVADATTLALEYFVHGALCVAYSGQCFISHAHMDHSGLLPRLVKAGFKGRIYLTPPTAELLKIMLLDSAHIQEMEAQWKSRRRRRYGEAEIAPLYTQKDAQETFRLFTEKAYGETFAPFPGLTVTFRDAGHILGAAMIDMAIQEEGRTSRVVFSGDVGRPAQLLVEDPEKITEAMDDDFNTALATGVLFDAVGDINSYLREYETGGVPSATVLELAGSLLAGFNSVLGLFPVDKAGKIVLQREDRSDKLMGELIELIIKIRQEARSKKDWATADTIRNGLKEIGIILEDTPQGVRWKRQV